MELVASLRPDVVQVQLETVDNYSSSSQGIWYPDSLQPEMGYKGSGSRADEGLSGWFNPFAPVPSKLVVESFTEKLPEEGGTLQWTMPQYGSTAATAPNRGNLAIAHQDERPSWLSKPGFQDFCQLRAYPLTQLRRLCTALQGRSLPLDHPVVQTLVRQVLYHCGTLTDNQPPVFFWRTDWEAGGMLEALCEALSELAAEVEHAPREHGAVLLLGEAAAFLADWHPPLRAVARRFAAMAAGWAEDLEASAEGLPPAKARPMRAKQCLLRMTALLCYGGGELDAEDVQHMLCLAVQIRHGYLYGQGTPLQARLEELQVVCHWTMARRSHEVMRAAVHRPAMLTQALSKVLRRVVELAPLPWEQLRCPKSQQLLSACFQASGSNGRLYSINCLDGTVLEDGCPPSRLPKEILQHRLYRRSFGNWEFEVSKGGDGVHRTIAPLGGCYFEFFIKTSPQALEPVLVVTEIEEGSRHRLQLLDVGEGGNCGQWRAELPVRLRELHSHWLCR